MGPQSSGNEGSIGKVGGPIGGNSISIGGLKTGDMGGEYTDCPYAIQAYKYLLLEFPEIHAGLRALKNPAIADGASDQRAGW